MINPSGSVQVNGITDSELAEILEIKAKHQLQNQNQNIFVFNPQQLQTQVQGSQTSYANAVFSWQGVQGFQIVREIIGFLLGEDKDKAKAQGQ